MNCYPLSYIIIISHSYNSTGIILSLLSKPIKALLIIIQFFNCLHELLFLEIASYVSIISQWFAKSNRYRW